MYYIGFGALMILTLGFVFIEKRLTIKSGRIVYSVLMLAYMIFIALRPVKTKDTLAYINIYEWVSINNFYFPHFFEKIYSVEYGFVYLIQIFKCIFGKNYRVLFLCVTMFNYIVSMHGIKLILQAAIEKTKYEKKKIIYQNKGVPLLLFNSYIGFLYSGIAIRAGITLALSFCAMGYFMKKEYWKCCLSLIIAFLFQKTVAIMIIVLLCYKKLPVFSRKIYLIIWLVLGGMLIGQVGGFFTENIVKILINLCTKFHISGYSGYLRNFDFEIGKTDIWLWIMGGIFFLYKLDIKNYYKLLNVYLVGIFVLNFIYPIRASSRLYDYFIVFFIPVLILEYYLGTNRKPREKLEKNMILLGVSAINTIVMLRLTF